MAVTTHDPSENSPFDCVQSRPIEAEVQDIETDKVLHVAPARFDSHGTAWYGQVSGVRKYDLSDEDYQRLLKPIPDPQSYPLAPPDLDVHDPRDTDGCYRIALRKIESWMDGKRSRPVQ